LDGREPAEHLRHRGRRGDLVAFAHAATLGRQREHDSAAVVRIGVATDQAVIDETLDELRDRSGAELQLLCNEPRADRFVTDDPQQPAALG
jgi:hypothetical protein